MSKDNPRIINFISNGSPWAITNEMMDTIVAVAERQTDPEAVAKELGRPLNNTRSVIERDGIAIIPMNGPVFPKANLFTAVSGAHSIDQLALDFTAAVKNSAIHSIIMHYETAPGGVVAGVNEFSAMIRDSPKRVISYVGAMAASAHYWMASAGSEIVVDATAQVGNIGVVQRRILRSSDNVLEIISSRAPDKRPDISTEQGLAVVQAELDALEDVFLSTVAKNLSKSVDEIASHRGRVLIGQAAVTAGFAHKIGSLESVIAELSATSTHHKLNRGRSMSTEKLEITKSMIAEKHPDIAEALRKEGEDRAKASMQDALTKAQKEGAEKELERIKSVESAALPGHEDLINALKFDGKTTGAEAALEIVKAERELQKDSLKSMTKDRPSAVDDDQELDEGDQKQAKQDYDTLMEKYIQEGKSRAEAIRLIVKNHPEAHKEKLMQANKRRDVSSANVAA